jgi:hypothetical protein
MPGDMGRFDWGFFVFCIMTAAAVVGIAMMVWGMA